MLISEELAIVGSKRVANNFPEVIEVAGDA
jgi:hypothetical protein